MAVNIYKLKEGYRIVNNITNEESLFNGLFNELLSKIDQKNGVHLYFPAEDFYVRKSILPNLDVDKLREILVFEMEDRFLVDSKELVMDFIPLYRSDKELTALIFAIEKSKLDGYLKAFGKDISNLKTISLYYDSSLENILDETSLMSSSLNFMPKEYLGIGKRYEKINLIKKLFFYTALILLIILLGEIISLLVLKKKHDRFKSELLSSAMMLSQGQKIEREPVSYIQSKLTDLKVSYRSLKGIEMLDMLKIFSENLPNGLKIKEINGESARFILKGECRDTNILEQFRVSIQKFTKVARTVETKNLPDGSINFILEVDVDEK